MQPTHLFGQCLSTGAGAGSFPTQLAGPSIRGTAQGGYPFTETAHPKYFPYVHNAIGNVFEIMDAVVVGTDLILRDIYWEPSEFTNSSGVPDIVLLFNNYGNGCQLGSYPLSERVMRHKSNCLETHVVDGR